MDSSSSSKMKTETPKERTDSEKPTDAPVPVKPQEEQEQKKPLIKGLFGWSTKDTRGAEIPASIRNLRRNRPRIVFPKPKYDYTNPPEDPAKTAALFAIVQAERPDFMKESYTDELKMFLPLNGDMSYGPNCDNFISLLDQRVSIMYQRSIRDFERKERIRQIELEKKRPPVKPDPILYDYDLLRPRLEKYMAERRRLGLSDKIFEELPSIIPMTKSVGLLEPSPYLVRAKQLLLEEQAWYENKMKLKEERMKQLALKNGTDGETSGSAGKSSDPSKDREAKIAMIMASRKKEREEYRGVVPAKMNYRPISIVPPSQNQTIMNEFTPRKSEAVCQAAPIGNKDSYTVRDSESFKAPNRMRTRRRNALLDMPTTSPLLTNEHPPRPRNGALTEREEYPSMRDRKRRNALLDFPREIPLHSMEYERESRRDSLMEIYSHKEIPLSVIDPNNKAYRRKPYVQKPQEEYTDHDILKSDPVLYREQLKELEYYQNLKKKNSRHVSRSQTSLDMEIDVVGSSSSTITDFTLNNPSSSSPYSPYGPNKKESSSELPVVIPLELVGEKIKPASLKSELMGLVDNNKSRGSLSTDCSSDSLSSLPTPEDSLITLQKKIFEQASFRNALSAQQALQAQQVSYLENFNTNLKNLGKIGVEAEPNNEAKVDSTVAEEIDEFEGCMISTRRDNPLAKINVKEMKKWAETHPYELPPEPEYIEPARKCLKTIPWYDIEQYLEHSPTSFRNLKKRGYRVPENFDQPPPPKKPWKMSRELKRELFHELITLMELQKERGVPVTPIPGLMSDDEDDEEEDSSTKKQEQPLDKIKEAEKVKVSDSPASPTPDAITAPYIANFHIAAEPTRFEQVGQLSIIKQLSVSREATEEHFRNKRESLSLKSKPGSSTILRSKSLNNNVYPSPLKKKTPNGVKLSRNEKPARKSVDSSTRKSSFEFKHPSNVMPIGIKRDQSTSRRGSEEEDKNGKNEEPSPKRRPPPVIQSTLDDEDAYNSIEFNTSETINVEKEKNTFYVPDEDSDDDMNMEDELPEQKPPPVVLKLKSSLNSRKRLESSTRNLSDENAPHARKIREETNRLAKEDLYLTSSLKGSNNSEYCRTAISKQSLESQRRPMEEMRLEKRQKLSHDEPDIKVNADNNERAAVTNGENRQKLSGLVKPELIADNTQQSQSSKVFDMAKTLKALKYYKKFLKMESAHEMGLSESKRDNYRVYVEESDKFRIRKEARYELGKRSIDKTKYIWSHEEMVENLQKYFTYLSFLIQGVLTGLLLGDTIYTFSFENEKALPKDQALALPLNSVMCAGCTVACIAVLDILTNMKATVENQAKREKLIVALALWIVALTTSALSIASDEILSPVNENALDEEGLLFRKLYCLTRSLSALGAWVFITYGMEMKRPKNEIGVNADVSQHVADELD